MSVIGSNIIAGSSGQFGYNLTRSLRFRSSASAYLNRTFGTPTDNKKYTISFWIKRGTLSSRSDILTDNNTSNISTIGFQSDSLVLQVGNGSGSAYIISSAVYRDPSAWYHVVGVVDTAQATDTNRLKMYVNGVQVTSLSATAYPTQNFNPTFNSASSIGNIARYNGGGYLDGYLTELNFIDGQALTPSSFGANNAQTGVWQPKRYAGTYGTNGFYLPFTDNSALTSGSNAGLGKDFSGNGNYWNTNNISITAGSTYDSMTDVPTLTSATAANFAVMNPLIRSYSAQSWTLSNGNLQYTDTGSGGGWGLATISATSGKWYWEGTVTANAKNHGMGWTTIGNISFGYNGCYSTNGGVNNTTGGSATTFATYTTNDVIGIAVDVTAGKVWFSKNGTFLGSGDPVAGTNPAFTFTGGTESAPTFCLDNSAGTSGSACNFGQRPFTYTPPSGYVALNTFNLPTPTIGATATTQANKYFDVSLWTGNVTNRTITNSGGFQADLVWAKDRSAARQNSLSDVVRGTNKELFSDSTDPDTSPSTPVVTAFGPNGFSIGENGLVNANGETFVAWQWKANGTGVTNTAGSITSTISANTSSGFSIVTYTGNGSSGATVGHGLGVAPKMIIVKHRNSGIAHDWRVYHASLGNTKNLKLNLGDAEQTTSVTWNNTSPSSTVFTLGSGGAVNENGTNYVAYCFAEVAGFSKIGSYTGTFTTDGPFVYTGFKPKFVMLKASGDTGSWNIIDGTRNTSNVINARLFPNLNNAENTATVADFLSNGFKIRSSDSDFNYTVTNTYIAFAEHPFKYSLAR
jgi:hypothetical protein